MGKLALIVLVYSVGAWPPGSNQSVWGNRRASQVDSPTVAGIPVEPLLSPSAQSTRTRCNSKVELTAAKAEALTTVICTTAEVITELTGIWLRSNRRSARAFKLWAVPPAANVGSAP